ncbi:MAG TPA: helix-hairpin-helix domain-containing protein [Thermoanaerobaculia bacterium]|nr:helix-hairpin-helix domain-containing protein [Thermoanaerobaculia bacterium]
MKTIRRTTAAVALAALLAAFGAPLAAAESPQGQVNVNSATAEQLALLPRVGPATAERIVAFREENGAFAATEDLMLVRGIGEKTFALMEPYVALSGETTLTDKVRSPRKKASADDERR